MKKFPILSKIKSLNDSLTHQILSLSDILTSVPTNLSGNAVFCGNTMTIYMYGNALKTAQQSNPFATLKQKYRPKLPDGSYVIVPLLSATNPYSPVGSVWFYGNTGGIRVYQTGSDGYYVSITYVCEG